MSSGDHLERTTGEEPIQSLVLVSDANAGSLRWRWVEADKHEELENQVKALQKSLAESNKLVEMKDSKVKRLKERLGHFIKEYPEFEFNREWYLELLEEEKINTKLVEELKPQVDHAYEDIQEKEEEVSRLTRRIDALKAKQIGNESSMDQAIRELLNADGIGREAIFILPEEVWQMILNQVTDPKDLRNLSSTCSLFRKMLQEHDYWKPTWLFQQAFPLIFRYLTKKKILKCRLVSKGWNMVVDQYMNSHPSLRPHDKIQEPFHFRMLPFASPMEERKLHFLYKFNFNRNRFDARFPEFPHVPGRNPLLGRAVTIVIGLKGHKVMLRTVDKIDYEWYWTDVLFFLEAFGEYIWYLTLNSFEGGLDEDDEEQQGYQEKMLQLLTVDLPALVPNLRKLRIIPSGYERYETLIDKIDLGSFEASPKLESIQADELNADARLLVLTAVMKRNHSTIRALHLSRYLWRSVFTWNLEWSNLTELYLDHLENEDDFKMLWEPEDDAGVRMPLLRKLGVNLRGLEGSFDWLLDAIHRFWGVAPLTTLRICGGIQPNMFQQIRWKSCVSPTLKTLEVEHGKGDDFYTFLIHFPLVENIHVFLKRIPPPDPPSVPPRPSRSSFRFLGNVDEKEEEVHSEVDDDDREVEDGFWEISAGDVDVRKYLRRGRLIYLSNIWELMPRLKLFTFKWDKFSRAGYEAFKEKQKKSRSFTLREAKLVYCQFTVN